MKKLVSLILFILIIFSLTACGSSTKTEDVSADMVESVDKVEIRLPGLYIVESPVIISREDTDFSYVDYEFYLESCAISMALDRDIQNGIYIVTINEYKFEVFVKNGKVLNVYSEKV